MSIVFFIVGFVLGLLFFAFCIKLTAKLLNLNQPSYAASIAAMAMNFVMALILGIFIFLMLGPEKTIALYQNNLIFSLLVPLLIGSWSYSLVLKIDLFQAVIVYIVSSVMATIVIASLIFGLVGAKNISQFIVFNTNAQVDEQVEKNLIESLEGESAIVAD